MILSRLLHSQTASTTFHHHNTEHNRQSEYEPLHTRAEIHVHANSGQSDREAGASEAKCGANYALESVTGSPTGPHQQFIYLTKSDTFVLAVE